MSAVHLNERLILRLQSLLSAPIWLAAGIFPIKTGVVKGGYIYSQASLKGQKYFLARAEYTACEAVAIYNALIYLKKPTEFDRVRSAFLTSGALTLFFVGFFGGNPYSLGRVLRRFGVQAQYVKHDEITEGGCILSFFNRGSLSLHTIFCERRSDGFYAYNLFPSDRAPRRIDPSKPGRDGICCVRVGSGTDKT